MVFRPLASIGCVDDGGGCGRNTDLASSGGVFTLKSSKFITPLAVFFFFAALQLSNSSALWIFV